MDFKTTLGSSIGNVDLPSYIAEIQKEQIKSFDNQMENTVIEGLKRKGFQFKNRLDLIEFIKDRCRCEDNLDLKERVYYVDDKPFFLHKYESKIDSTPLVEDRKITMYANFGSFSYL